MPEKDPSHWLYRLTPDEWLAAAVTELSHCEATLLRRSARAGVTHARRGAGMALNALLSLQPSADYGRSYMEHVIALSIDPTAATEVRQAAQALRDTPAAPSALVQIGRPDMSALDKARLILDYVRNRVATLS